jgi:5-methylcytosine-specific restriction endonuclease McrA
VRRWQYLFLAARDGERCARCGLDRERARKRNIPFQLTIHHIDHNPSNNSPENLQLLCRSCQMKEFYEHRRLLKD